MNETLNLPDLLDDPATFAADMQAVQHFSETGEPLDPAIVARVRARSERSALEDFKRRGPIDLQKYLLPSVDGEE